MFSNQLTGSVNRSGENTNTNNNNNEVALERVTYCMLYKELKNDKDQLYIEVVNKLDAAQAE